MKNLFIFGTGIGKVHLILILIQMHHFANASDDLEDNLGSLSSSGRGQMRVCPLGHFECKVSYLLCVPQSAICNSNPDCPDGSDEEDCLDPHVKGEWDWAFVKRPDEDAEKQNDTCWYSPPTLSPSDEFTLGTPSTHYPKKKSIMLSPLYPQNNGISGISKISGLSGISEVATLGYTYPSPEFEKFETSSHPLEDRDVGDSYRFLKGPESLSFGQGGRRSDLDELVDVNYNHWLTQGCLCAAEKLFCQNLGLDGLSFLPKSIQFLDLSGSRVENMDFTISPFPNLNTLVLSGCYVEDIVPGAFWLLGHLKVLYLTNNRLRYLANGVFATNPSGESSLTRLSLDYNQISVLQPGSFDSLGTLVELNLRHNLLTGRETYIFQGLTSLLILHLNNNKIEFLLLTFLNGLSALETLSLHSNHISYIEIGAFQNMTKLRQLYLNGNKLRVVENRVFCNLRSLLTLNLRGNEIVQMEDDAFLCLLSLTSLNVGKNRFGEITSARADRIFGNLTSLDYIYFDQFWMCWWAHHVRSCEPKGDGISSLTNLLDSVVLRVCVWIMGILSVVGNLFVIFCRIIIREPNRVHSFYIRNLAAADLLMGFFLLSIAIHDLSYRGEFLSYQYKWRHSLICQLSGVLSTWSSESSVLILTLITLDRYLSIVQPFAEKTTSLNVALCICSFLWILSFLLSFIPVVGLPFLQSYFGDPSTFYTSNGLCLPLHIHNPYDPGWQYSFVLFVLINSVAFIFICFAYFKMLKVIRRSTLMIRSTQQKQDSLLAKRFALVVVTDFLCWAPIVVTKVLGMAGVAIPSDLYAWLAVFALPVNSALNPIIYTLTTKLFKQQIGKMARNFHFRLWRNPVPDDSTASLSLFRYRTQRSGNTSMTHSVKQGTKTSRFGMTSMNNSSVKATTIQLKILVTPTLPNLTNPTPRTPTPNSKLAVSPSISPTSTSSQKDSEKQNFNKNCQNDPQILPPQATSDIPSDIVPICDRNGCESELTSGDFKDFQYFQNSEQVDAV